MAKLFDLGMLMDKETKQFKKLMKEMHALQESGELIWGRTRKTRMDMWKHVAEIYFFYQHQIKTVERLNGLLEQFGMQFKSELKSGINFGALLRLIWGDNNCSRDEISKNGLAMNAIHAHYSKKPDLYAKDGVVKMANWISSKGGISKLASGSNAEQENKKQRQSSLSVPAPSENEILECLVNKSEKIITNLPVTTPITTSSVTAQVQTSRDNLGVLLVRHTNNGFDIVGSSKDTRIIELVKADTYRRSLNGLSLHLRCILEVIKTQCLPHYLQAVQNKIIDNGKTRKKSDGKARAHRRLLFIGEIKQYVLSPTDADAGVVTVALPVNTDFLDTNDDLALSYRARKRIERDLISNDDFHLYNLLDAHRPYDYPESNACAYVARLEHSINSAYNFIHLDFWRSEVNDSNSVEQVYGHPPTGKLQWEFELEKNWFRYLAYNVLDKWLEGSGKHMSRKEHRVCKATFSDTGIRLCFTRNSKGFAITRDVPFDTPNTNARNVECHFLTKDLVPALRCVADLDISTNVKMKLSSDVLCLEYSTAAGEYIVLIPQTSSDGTRIYKHFTQYTPKQFISFETEHGIDTEEQDLDT